MEHYFSENPTSKELKFRISAKLRNNDFEFYSSAGVFSKKQVDIGTELLADSFIIHKEDATILDIGCGIGIIGIVCAEIYPATHVLLTDINNRALRLTYQNIKINKLKNCEIRHSNLYERIDEKFDVILSNPPQTAGKDVCFRLIEEAKNHLNQNGTLQLVARHNKGGSTLAKKMKETFGNMEILSKRSGFRIYISKIISL